MTKIRIVNIGEVCNVLKGTSITLKKVTAGNIPVIAGGQQPAYYHNEANRNGKTITISCSGAYAGFVNYFEIPIFASDCTTVQSKDEKIVLTKYVYLILKGQQKRIYAFQQGAGQPHVYPKDILTLQIPLPSIETQKRIVTTLELAEQLRDKRNKANEETDKIIQSIFNDMFGDPTTNKKNWKVKKWEDVVEIINGRVQKDVIDAKGKYPIYGSGGNIMGYAREYLAPENSIIIGRKGTINRPVKITTKFWNVDTAFALTPKGNEINSDYLFIFCQLFNFEKLNTSTTLPSLTKNNLLKIDMPVPPIDLQNKFAKIVETIEGIRSKQKQSTDEINTLFDALMQKAFNGELVV